jgi:hypothetical protein
MSCVRRIVPLMCGDENRKGHHLRVRAVPFSPFSFYKARRNVHCLMIGVKMPRGFADLSGIAVDAAQRRRFPAAISRDEWIVGKKGVRRIRTEAAPTGPTSIIPRVDLFSDVILSRGME